MNVIDDYHGLYLYDKKLYPWNKIRITLAVHKILVEAQINASVPAEEEIVDRTICKAEHYLNSSSQDYTRTDVTKKVINELKEEFIVTEDEY